MLQKNSFREIDIPKTPSVHEKWTFGPPQNPKKEESENYVKRELIDLQYFEDYKILQEDSSKRSISVRLSKVGKKKFATGRSGALFQLGEIQHVNLTLN